MKTFANNSRILHGAGLVFIDLGHGPAASFQRLAILFFTMLMFELIPFCYMSFYVADRKFYAADVAAGLYHPSAYYLAQSIAGNNTEGETGMLVHKLLWQSCGDFVSFGPEVFEN